MLKMNHLPILDRSARVPDAPDWGRAAGNIEDAKIAVEALKSLVQDAVYLDDDAYSGALNQASYQGRLQASGKTMQCMVASRNRVVDMRACSHAHRRLSSIDHLKYKAMGPLTFQDANRRLKELEHESIALRADFDSKSEEIASLRLQLRQALAEIDDLKLEIENNAGEFSILGSGY